MLPNLNLNVNLNFGHSEFILSTYLVSFLRRFPVSAMHLYLNRRKQKLISHRKMADPSDFPDPAKPIGGKFETQTFSWWFFHVWRILHLKQNDEYKESCEVESIMLKEVLQTIWRQSFSEQRKRFRSASVRRFFSLPSSLLDCSVLAEKHLNQKICSRNTFGRPDQSGSTRTRSRPRRPTNMSTNQETLIRNRRICSVRNRRFIFQSILICAVIGLALDSGRNPTVWRMGNQKKLDAAMDECVGLFLSTSKWVVHYRSRNLHHDVGQVLQFRLFKSEL